MKKNNEKEKDWKELNEWKEEREKIKLENEINITPKSRGLERLEEIIGRLQIGITILGFIAFFIAILFVIMKYHSLNI